MIFGATTGPIGTNLDGNVYWNVSKEIISFAIGNAQKEQEAQRCQKVFSVFECGIFIFLTILMISPFYDPSKIY